MIEINIINSPDKEKLGKFKFFYDSISLGTSFKNDIIIEDPSLNEVHLTLYIEKENFFCETNGVSSSMSINSKTFKGKKAFSKKDKIKIGNTILEILDYSLEPQLVKGPSIKESYENLLQKFPEQEKIIDQMENELSVIEELIRNQPSNS